jgi:hypothetical protein
MERINSASMIDRSEMRVIERPMHPQAPSPRQERSSDLVTYGRKESKVKRQAMIDRSDMRD